MAGLFDILKRKIGIGKYKFNGSFELGQLYYFRYNPKFRDVLSFYDGKPLVFFIGKNQYGNLMGLNIHFIPMKLRERMFKQIKFRTDGKPLKFTMLKGIGVVARFFPSIIRSYIPSRMRGIITIPLDQATLNEVKSLPTEKFFGKSSDEIFKITMSMKNAKRKK